MFLYFFRTLSFITVNTKACHWVCQNSFQWRIISPEPLSAVRLWSFSSLAIPPTTITVSWYSVVFWVISEKYAITMTIRPLCCGISTIGIRTTSTVLLHRSCQLMCIKVCRMHCVVSLLFLLHALCTDCINWTHNGEVVSVPVRLSSPVMSNVYRLNLVSVSFNFCSYSSIIIPPPLLTLQSDNFIRFLSNNSLYKNLVHYMKHGPPWEL